jgi:hypothetical protein
MYSTRMYDLTSYLLFCIQKYFDLLYKDIRGRSFDIRVNAPSDEYHNATAYGFCERTIVFMFSLAIRFTTMYGSIMNQSTCVSDWIFIINAVQDYVWFCQ